MNTIIKYTFVIVISLYAATAVAEPADRTSQNVNELKEVVVEGRRVEQIKDGINIRPTKLEKDASFSGWNLLEVMQPPTLIYDPRSKAFKDMRENPVSYFINNIAATQAEVENLPASLIVSVQVLNNPSDPMFEASAAVVNIIAREYDYGGYTILSYEQSFLRKGGYGSVFSKYQRKNWTLQFLGFGSYSNVPGSTMDTHSIYRFTVDGNPLEIVRNSSTKEVLRKYTYFNGAVSSTLRFGENNRNLFVVNLVGTHYTGPKQRLEGETDYSLTGEHSSTINDNDGKYTAPGIYASVSFNGDDGKYFQIKTGVSGSFNDNDYKYFSDFNSGIQTFIKEKAFTPMFVLTFSKTFSKGNALYMMLDNYFTRTIADYTGSTSAKNTSTLGVDDFKIYYSHPINDKLSAVAGAYNGMIYYGTGISDTRFYYHPQYFMSLTWRPTRVSQAYITGGIDRKVPEIVSINSVIRKTDELIEVSGNPEISPSMASNVRIGYSLYSGSKFSLSASLGWDHTDRLLVNDYIYHDGTILSRYTNSGSQDKYSLFVSSNIRLFNGKLTVSPYLNVYHANRGGLTSFDWWTVNGSVNVNYIPFKGMRLSSYIFSPTSKYPNGDGYSYERKIGFIISASYKYRDWFFELESMPFSKYRDLVTIQRSHNLYSRTDHHDKQGRAYIQASVRFSFDYGKKMDIVQDLDTGIGKISGVR